MTSVELFFNETGRGVPVMLLHGYSLDHSIWQPIIPLMKDEAHLIMPDLRGHGRSPAPDGIYWMHDMAADLLALMDRLGLQKVILAGHSMGGYVALHFAHAYPERLSALALVASHCFKDDDEKAKSRVETAQKVEKMGSIDFVVESMLPSLTASQSLQNQVKELMLRTKPKGVSGVLQGMAERKSMCETLAAIEQPVVIIAGDDDKLISTEKAKEMTSMLRKPWLEIIPGAGHLPMLEKPKETAKVITALMKMVD